MLCAKCHLSEALQGSGYGNIPPLTTSIHSLHAGVTDPTTGMTLDSVANRSSCYRCHPGSSTKCLRGAMGSAIAGNGTMEMQCQSCHGNLSAVGSTSRVGWFMEPNCQSCHSGTATSNNGQIRYTSSFDASGNVRAAVNQTFATTPNAPATGLSLFRFSVGHGGLQCSACHGSTHAEFPTSEPNDNIRNTELQGHAGPMVECAVCHATVPSTSNGGPHGMHPVGSSWVSAHQGQSGSACQACHGTDYRGTVLSEMQADRTINGRSLFRGAIVSCYICHNGPGGSGTPPAAPTASSVSASTVAGQSVAITLPVSGSGAYPRIISQPANGTVGLSTNGSTYVATYYPAVGFGGTDTFTFAAYNGYNNSALATATVKVGGGSGPIAPTITTQPASQTVTAGANVSFSVVANGTAPLSYQWQKNGVNVAGATATSLSMVVVTTANAGTYRVIVSNAAGSVTSAAATLTVNSVAAAPTITTQPASATVAAGGNISFIVVATGTAPLSYQWQKDGVNVAGATAASLSLVNVSSANAGNYRVIVSNTAGSVTSATATLTVNSMAIAPTITTQPTSRTVTAGATVSFSVVATGTAPLSYQWLKNGVNLTGATSATLTLTSVTTNNAGSYRVRVSNSAGSVTSAPATLTVNASSLSIRLTSPTNGAVYNSYNSVQLTASVSTSQSIARVQFYDGATLLGSDTSSPYTLTTRIQTAGTHVLTAKVTTTSGATASSTPVQITVRQYYAD